MAASLNFDTNKLADMMPLISLLLPTRARPELARRFLETAFETYYT